MGDFDFLASLNVVKADVPDPASKRRQVENNPFVAWVGDSFSEGTGRAVPVENQHVKKTVYLIRQAANDLGLGVRIVTSLTQEEMDKAAKSKKVTISFQGTKRRAYSKRGSNAAETTVPEPTPSTPAPAAAPDGTNAPTAPETPGQAAK